MIPKEILSKVRRIEITTSRLVTNIFAGEYHSVFKGRGMEFDEVREYQYGDDIRSIDWNVTARTGVPHIKKFIEEREMTVMVLVDASKSCQFGTDQYLKSDLAAEIAAVLAFSAIKNNDKIGLMIFTDQVELFIPPRKGRKHVLRMIREVLYFKPKGIQTDITRVLEHFNKVMSRKAVTFLISDFMDDTQSADHQPAYYKAMSIVQRYHDLIAVTLNDAAELNLPDAGLVQFQDAESGAVHLVDTSNPVIRQAYHTDAVARLKKRARMFQSLNMDHIDIQSNGSYIDELVRFFSKRKAKNH